MVTPGRQLSQNSHSQVLPPSCSPSRLPSYGGKNKPSRQPCLPVWRWWSAHLSALRTPSACPSLFSITFGVAVDVLIVLLSSLKKKTPCLLKDQNGQKAGESLPLYTTPFQHVSLSPNPPGLGVMFSQRCRDRTVFWDQVSLSGDTTKLLTPQS